MLFASSHSQITFALLICETANKRNSIVNPLNNLNAWNALKCLADTGAMNLAAEVMQVEASTISRLIASLERALGQNLIQRKTRPTVLTEYGKRSLADVRPILEAHQVFITSLKEDTSEMSGTIRFSVAPGTLPNLLMPQLMEFQELYPDVEFKISSGRQIAECLSGKVDVASINGLGNEKGLVVLERGHPAYIPVASPDYLKKYGIPETPESLKQHMGFVYTGPVRAPTTELVKNGEIRPIQWKRHMQSTDILMVKEAVVNGLGITVDIPLAHCHKELARGELVPILNGWHRPSLGAYVVCSQASWHIRRIRVFMRWFSEHNRRHFEALEKKAPTLLGEHWQHYFD